MVSEETKFTAKKIQDYIAKNNISYQPLYDLLDVAKVAFEKENDTVWALKVTSYIKECCQRAINCGVELLQMDDLYWKTMKAEAPYWFDSYLIYLERKRERRDMFYLPKRKQLNKHGLIQAMQDLEDSGDITRMFYDGVIDITTNDEEYCWNEIFPDVHLVSTDAKREQINFNKYKPFANLQCTSVGSKNAGKVRCNRYLYCDDLIGGIEEALNKNQLDKLWRIYGTDAKQRKLNEQVKEIHIATRWSVHDVIGRLKRLYAGNDRARFIAVPDIDPETGESNFDYEFGVGFSTKFYREQRDIMDSVSWKALYQNQPIEREGLVYHPDELRRFFELPAEEPDAIIGVCDTKDKGADYAFLPVGYVYGQDYYIGDCICDNGLPDTVDARLSEILVRDKVKMCRFESNSAGRRVAEKIQGEVKKLGGITNITTKFTTANKETKIIVNSAWVKEHCLFLDESKYKRNTDYGRMMDMLCSYTVAGKNKHDDVPDGMAMFAEFAQSLNGAVVEVFSRPF